jgi:hypothetical protein
MSKLIVAGVLLLDDRGDVPKPTLCGTVVFPLVESCGGVHSAERCLTLQSSHRSAQTPVAGNCWVRSGIDLANAVVLRNVQFKSLVGQDSMPMREVGTAA